MSTPWYKRLFARLRRNHKKDHEHQIHAYYAPNAEDSPSPIKKGKFRFPLIPDDDVQPQAENFSRKTSKTTAYNPISKPVQVYKDDQEERRRERIEILKERDRVFAEKGWLKKAQEVPSPVYGFNPPPKKKETVEEIHETVQDQLPNFSEPRSVEVPETMQVSDEEVYSETVEEQISEVCIPSLEHPVSEEIERVEPLLEQQPLEDEPIVQNTMEHKDEEPILKVVDTDFGQGEPQYVHEEPKVELKIKEETKKTKIPYNVFYFGEQNRSQYQFPKLQFLQSSPETQEDDEEWQMQMIEVLEQTLESFHVQAKVIGINSGPTVTRIELQPAPGVKVNRITNLIDDIKLSLAAEDIRIEAPVPGRSAVGIEIPNRVRQPVNIKDILASPAFQQSSSPMTVALGKDIEGKPVVMDLRKMPHGLIAGATGSGKSVCVNSIIISLLYKAMPEEVKLILIDPKMVELAPYHDLPHLATPVVTDPKQATMALKWAVEEMDRRYELFANSGVRDIDRYNQLMASTNPDIVRPALPYILIIIDELADLMMVSPADVEESIARIAQKARACGIHLLVATQRPSVDVITGMIKANIPTRIAFSVSSQVDSRTILDSIGAERLLGRGDMLLLENGSNKIVRLQGNYVSDEEIEAVCQFVRSQRKPSFLFDKESLIRSVTEEPEDELYQEAVEFVLEQGSASTSLLQRRFRIGYNRAARLIDMMEAQGVISESSGSKPRNVLMSLEEYQSLQRS